MYTVYSQEIHVPSVELCRPEYLIPKRLDDKMRLTKWKGNPSTQPPFVKGHVLFQATHTYSHCYLQFLFPHGFPWQRGHWKAAIAPLTVESLLVKVIRPHHVEMMWPGSCSATISINCIKQRCASHRCHYKLLKFHQETLTNNRHFDERIPQSQKQVVSFLQISVETVKKNLSSSGLWSSHFLLVASIGMNTSNFQPTTESLPSNKGALRIGFV